MRCNRCGSENKDGSVFCSFCGGKIATADTGSTVSTPSNVSNKGNDGFTDVFSDSHIQLNNPTGYSTDGANNTGTSNNDFNVNDINSNIANMNTQGSSDTTDTGNNSSGAFSGTGYQNIDVQSNANQNNVNTGFNSTGTSNYQGTNNIQSFDNNVSVNNQNNINVFNNLNGNNSNNTGFGYGQYNPNQSLNIGVAPNINNNRTNNKKFNKFGIIAACVVAVIILIFVFDVPTLLSGKRTIMIYMIGSDLESQYAAASSDIEEIKSSGVDFDDVNILIYTGGAKKWINGEIPDDKNAIFKVTSSGLVKLEEYERSSMTDPDNLTKFLNYGHDKFKSSKYSLILWDHGGGPIYGYGMDENYVGSLTLAKLKQGLGNSKFNGKKLEMIGFDACLMSSVEVADVLSDYANYMLASQEVEPGLGWDYSFLSNVTSKTSTVDMGMSIIDHYGSFYKKSSGVKGITLSLLDLSKASDVENKLNDLFKDVDDNLTIDYSTVSRTRNSAKSFGKVSINSSYDLVDLYDLVDKMPDKYSNKIESLQRVLDEFVVHQTTDLKSTYGVSIYFPYENKQYINEMIALYKGFDFAKEYTNFITNFSSRLTGNKMSNWKLSDNVPVEKNNTVSVTVPSDVAENYSSASYVIFEKADNNYYIPRFKGTDVSVSGNTFSTTISKKGFVASDDTDTVYLTVMESEKGKDYVKYLIPSVLQNWGDSISDNFEMKSAYIEFVVDKDHPKGYISSVVPIISNDNDLVAPKISYNLKDFKIVQLWNFSYKIFDDAGNYTTNWESSGTMNGFEFDLSKKFELEFRNLDVNKEYYVLFYINDNQGNRYTTNAVKINV